MLIGVTGGIGTGKSKVAEMLAQLLGATLVNADAVCRELLETGKPGYIQFVQRYGGTYLERPAGPIDRHRLRTALFADDCMRRDLENILHPMVRRILAQSCSSNSSNGSVVAEVPLLFESGWQDDFDVIVCVDAPQSTVTNRVVARDGVASAEVQRIIKLQLPQEKKKQMADWVINNDGSEDALKDQVTALAAAVGSGDKIGRKRIGSAKKLDTPGESTYKG